MVWNETEKKTRNLLSRLLHDKEKRYSYMIAVMDETTGECEICVSCSVLAGVAMHERFGQNLESMMREEISSGMEPAND
ncbi:MAG TPA: hypothetical protein VIJ14_00150 [Rhabdochlamydiaceae bacterium]